jgi:hypothetical protein
VGAASHSHLPPSPFRPDALKQWKIFRRTYLRYFFLCVREYFFVLFVSLNFLSNITKQMLLFPHQDRLSSTTMATTTTTIITTTLIPHTPVNKFHRPTFPISELPYELRQLIYSYYLSLLPPLHINKNTLRSLPHPALIRSSPLFACDIPPPVFYKHATFAFSSVADLLLFARPPHGHRVRNVRILSHQDGKGGDWVYCTQRCFPDLEEIVYEMPEGQEMQCELEGWWERVLDALREGRGTKREELRVSVEKGGGQCLTQVL